MIGYVKSLGIHGKVHKSEKVVKGGELTCITGTIGGD